MQQRASTAALSSTATETVPRAPLSRPAPRPGFLRQMWKHRTAYAFVFPALVFFSVFKIYPILSSFLLSFRQYELFPGPWIGLENYRRVLEDTVFHRTLVNTTIAVVVVAFFGTVLAYLVALVLQADFPGSRLYQLLFFLPVVTSVTVASLVWRILYNPAPFGLINSLLAPFGIPPQGWLSDPDQALGALMVPLVWKIIGYNMVIFIAAIRSVDPSLLEAAEVEGANVFQKVRYVIIPATRFAISMVVVLAVLRTYRLFVPVYVMTFGDPDHRTETIVTWIYKQSFRFWDMGYGAALSVLLFLIIMVLTLVQFRLTREQD